MRCSKCETELPEGASACPSCGEPAAKPKKRTVKPVVIIAIILAALLAAAVTVGVLLRKSGRGCAPEKETEANVTPTDTAAPAPTEAPVEVTDEPAQSEAPAGATDEPAPDEATPLPDPDITVVDPVLRTDDTPPIDALVSFMLRGDPDSARKALPGGYITHLADQYGLAAKILGENNVIRIAGGIVKKNLGDQYGGVSEITYDVISRRALTDAEMETAIAQLKEMGVEDVPTEGHLLDLRLNIKGSNGDQALLVAPRVLLFGDTWYLHPADIDELTA